MEKKLVKMIEKKGGEEISSRKYYGNLMLRRHKRTNILCFKIKAQEGNEKDGLNYDNIFHTGIEEEKDERWTL